MSQLRKALFKDGHYRAGPLSGLPVPAQGETLPSGLMYVIEDKDLLAVWDSNEKKWKAAALFDLESLLAKMAADTKPVPSPQAVEPVPAAADAVTHEEAAAA